MTNSISATMRGTALLLAMSPVAACAEPAGQSTTGNMQNATAGMTLQQFTSRHERKILAADTDGDGKVSKAEFVATAKAGKGDPATRFARIDTNGDGLLDKAEIDAMLARRFRKLDADGDGVVSAAERAGTHARNGQHAGKDIDS